VDKEEAKEPLLKMRGYSRYLIHIGLLFYMLGIKINKSVMLPFLFLANLAMHAPSLSQYFQRLGADTSAYVNQAG
jgi:hypothetical protein